MNARRSIALSRKSLVACLMAPTLTAARPALKRKPDRITAWERPSQSPTRATCCAFSASASASPSPSAARLASAFFERRDSSPRSFPICGQSLPSGYSAASTRFSAPFRSSSSARCSPALAAGMSTRAGPSEISEASPSVGSIGSRRARRSPSSRPRPASSQSHWCPRY